MSFADYRAADYSTAELGVRSGIPRLTTVRNVALKIREAQAAENASERLAGLALHLFETRAT